MLHCLVRERVFILKQFDLDIYFELGQQSGTALSLSPHIFPKVFKFVVKMIFSVMFNGSMYAFLSVAVCDIICIEGL